MFLHIKKKNRRPKVVWLVVKMNKTETNKKRHSEKRQKKYNNNTDRM